MKKVKTLACLLSIALLTATGLVTAQTSNQTDQTPVQIPSSEQNVQKNVQQNNSVKQVRQYRPRPKSQRMRHFIRVHRGDTLYSLSQRYHTSIGHLKRLNHMRGNTIYVGQRLRVR